MYYITLDLEWNQAYAQKALAVQKRLACRLRGEVIQIGAVKVVGGTVVDSLSLLVNPKVPLKEKIVKLTGITDMMLADKETAETAIPKLMEANKEES